VSIFSPHFGQKSLSYESRLADLADKEGAVFGAPAERAQEQSDAPNKYDVSDPNRPASTMRLPQSGHVLLVVFPAPFSCTPYLLDIFPDRQNSASFHPGGYGVFSIVPPTNRFTQAE
jgi:hypothetical protein